MRDFAKLSLLMEKGNDNDKALAELEAEMYADLYEDELFLRTHPDFAVYISADKRRPQEPIYGMIYKRKTVWFFWTTWELVDHIYSSQLFFKSNEESAALFEQQMRSMRRALNQRLKELIITYKL